MVNYEIRLIIFFAAKDGKPLYKTKVSKVRPGVDYAQDHQLLIVRFRLKLKIVRKKTRPLRYDLNQVLYDYTVEGMNRFKRLNLVDRVPEELWTEVCNIIQEEVTKPYQREKNARRQYGCLMRLYKQPRKEEK